MLLLNFLIMCLQTPQTHFNRPITFVVGPMWAREYCRINSPHILAKYRKRRLKPGSFVLLYFVSFALSEMYLISAFSVF